MRLAVLWLIWTASGVGAQELLWKREGVFDQLRLSGPLAAIGDVDGDGIAEVAVVVSRFVPNVGRPNELWLVSSQDASITRSVRYDPKDTVFAVAGVGDMDRDGTRDYAISLFVTSSLPLRNVVEVRSGRNDNLIWTHSSATTPSFGWRLAGDLDLDGDGRPDLLVGDASERDPSGTGPGGAIYAYDNAGNLLYKLFGSEPGHAIGLSLAKVGDVDGDGRDDFAMGGGEPMMRGVAYLRSGATGREIRRVFGVRPYDFMGNTVTGCGDLDGDGVPDFASGSGGFNSRGIVRVFSSATGQAIHTLFGGPAASGSTSNGFGEALAGGIDVDQDGIGDLVVGAVGEVVTTAPPLDGVVYVFSGRDGTPIVRIPADAPSGGLIGLYIAALPPQPGSPFPLFMTAAPGWGFGGLALYLGRIYMFRGSPSGVSAIGSPCPGTLPRAPRIGLRDLGAKGLRLQLSDAEPGELTALILGVSKSSFQGIRLPISLHPAGLSGCLLHVSADHLFVRRTARAGIDAGYASVDLPLPLATGRGTFDLFGQWLALGSGCRFPGGVSAALEWRH